jgi:pyruvate formate lyase activating enzyme
MTAWIASLTDAEGKTVGTEVPLHISRFFPRFHMTDRKATDVRKVYSLAEVARERLEYVYTGNC